ncbi:MAG TPA: DUF1552 domain-containing protein [Polyangiales bacterium]|nr:DUF1552 domain-containing protein [Polyangiales bacterium]
MDERWLISRRTLLGGIGLAGVSYFLPKGSNSRAAAQSTAPTRLLVVHVPEGMWRSASRPSASGASFGPIFGPLDMYKPDITFINNLSMKSRDKGPGGDGHHRGVPHMFTGIEMLDEGNAGGPSVDQKIANAIGGSSKYKSLQFAVRIVYTDTNSRPIWSAPGRVVPALQSPWDAYTRIFGNGTMMPATSMPSGTPAPTTPKVDIRKSALDYALAETATLRTKLTVSDRERLDSYQESLRDIERRLTAPMLSTADCVQPTLGNKVDVAAEANYPAIGKLQMDLIVAAFQCGVTRVASLQWGNSNDQCRYPWLGVNAIGHDLAHNNGNVDPSGSKKTTVFNWYSQQFAYLLGKLKNVKEGTGTMLDNTVVLWASEFGESNGHSGDNLLWCLMGNAGGYFKQGQVLDMKGRSTNDLHATLQNAFGIADKTFGGAAYCAGAINELKA